MTDEQASRQDATAARDWAASGAAEVASEAGRGQTGVAASEAGRGKTGVAASEAGRGSHRARPHVDAPRIDVSADEARAKLEAREEEKRSARLKSFAIDKTPKKLKNPTDLQVRFRTGFVYVAITLIGLFTGNIPCAIMLSITAGVCAGEFYYVLRSDNKQPNEALGIIAAVLYPLVMLVFGMKGVAIFTLVFMLALLVWYVFWMSARIADVCISFFGAAYTGMLLSAVLPIRMAVPEPWCCLVLFIIFGSVWANDGFAYLVGSRFGKHKMVPRISPKKSWEGFFAGIITSMIFWCALVPIPGVTISVPQALLFGAICGIMSVIGDLAESRIKRNSGVKDSGTIMPGHGGLLDRCDSLFLAIVTAAVLLIVGGCVPFVD